ncbi:JAB domain-containing protein [Pseudostreptobacillus hongkongensis]|uniref:JAB domain-containing protein n=1 Tax=Pseudostreptobacillus hongkongensis TaxID=1162717 RepID=UPI00082D40A2|nr:JAB domain-containing protein [Pseudostreptobacillus hongkongensis]
MDEIKILKKIIKLSTRKNDEKSQELSINLIENVGNITNLIKKRNELNLPKNLALILNIFSEIIEDTLKCKTFDKKKKILSYGDLINYLKYDYFDKEREIFKVLYFNTKCMLIKDENLFYGTIDKADIYSREIAKRILKYNAKSVILVHNHPSGDTKPSKQDLSITKELQQIFKYFEIKLSDHIIISNEEYYSFLENGDI